GARRGEGAAPSGGCPRRHRRGDWSRAYNVGRGRRFRPRHRAGGSRATHARVHGRGGGEGGLPAGGAPRGKRSGLPVGEGRKARMTKTLQELAHEDSSCTRCRLASGRTQVVFGVGNPDAGVMFIGEGPGYYEDKQGEPFV